MLISLTRRFSSLTLVALTGWVLPAYAESVLPEPIAHLVNQGMRVEESFAAASGLQGWVMAYEQEYKILYTTEDGQTLIAGPLWDARGRNLSEGHQRQYLPQPAFADLAESRFISEKASASERAQALEKAKKDPNQDASALAKLTPETLKPVYVFFDANCPFCHLAWQALQPYVALGLEVRWIPVAYLRPDSRQKAAAMLSAAQPLELLRLNMREFGKAPKALLEAKVSDQARQALQDNMQLMQDLGLQGTPGIVWQDAQGRLQQQGGMPRLSRLPEITGLPEQVQSAPELARFR